MKFQRPELPSPKFLLWWSLWLMLLVADIYLGVSPPSSDAPAGWTTVWSWVTAAAFMVLVGGAVAISVVWVYSPERDSDDSGTRGPLQFTRAWLGHMADRLRRVRDRFRGAQGASCDA
jgi:hypothetical protein